MFLLNQLETLLQWQPTAATTLNDVSHLQWELSYERLTDGLSSASGPVVRPLADRIGNLGARNEAAFARTFMAPRTQYHLLLNGPQHAEHLLVHFDAALRAEIGVRDRDGNPPRVTAYGEEITVDPVVEGRLGVWHGPCLRLTGGKVLDFGSCYWRDRQRADASPHAKTAQAGIARAIVHAFESLPVISPVAAELVERFIHSIFFYSSPSRRGFSSGSQRFRFGEIEFTNVQHMDAASILENLVHESVHVIIEVIELVESFYTPIEQRANLVARSPWSGNEISTMSLAHACFVWYALYWLWDRAQETPWAASVVARRMAERRQQTARRGFLGAPLTAMLEETIEPPIAELIDRLQRNVANHTPARRVEALTA